MKANKAQIYFVVSLIMGLLFITLSYFVHQDVFRSLDYDSMVILQSTFSRKWDIPMSLFTPLGSSEIMTSFVIIIFLWNLIKYKNLYLSLLLYFLIFIFELTGKTVIFHPDPPSMFNRYSLGLYFPSSFIVHTNFSYPSGHMARVAFVLLILIYFLWRRNFSVKRYITAGLLIFILFGTFISRIYLGEHWLSDVLGGLVLGSTFASLAIGLM